MLAAGEVIAESPMLPVVVEVHFSKALGLQLRCAGSAQSKRVSDAPKDEDASVEKQWCSASSCAKQQFSAATTGQ